MRIIVSLLFLLVIRLFSFGQISEIIGKSSYPFLLSIPDTSVVILKKPLLIFLHGRSLSGNNLQTVRKYGIIHEIDKGRKIPGYVIAPQVKAGESWNPEKLNELLNFMIANYEVDTNRVYVAGMSLGGYGTLHFVGKYSSRIAAAAAFCGGGNPKDACSLGTVPLWIIHGTADKAVPYSESQKMARAIENCTGKDKLTFTTITGGGHGSPEKYFRMDSFYSWLWSFQKN